MNRAMVGRDVVPVAGSVRIHSTRHTGDANDGTLMSQWLEVGSGGLGGATSGWVN